MSPEPSVATLPLGAAASDSAEAAPPLLAPSVPSSAACSVRANGPDAEAVDALAVLDDPVEQRRFTRYLQGDDGHAQAESALRLAGMHCAACAGLIEQALSQVDGVLSAHVSAVGERALVRWLPGRTGVATIVRAIRAAGYDASPDTAAQARVQRQQAARTALWRFFVAAFCAMQVMMLATPSYVATGDDLAPDLRQLLNWGSWLLTLPVMVFSASPFFSGAWRSLRQRRIGMDVPVALGVLVTFVASTGATFEPTGLFGHEVYFDSLTMFLAFLLGGRWLESRARQRVASSLESALGSMPETALRLDVQGQAETVSVQRLVAGDRVRVPVGQAFPADGELVLGDTEADEALLTGESLPVAKACGAAVVAGSVNLAAPVEMRVLLTGDDTRLAGIVALMQQAMTQRPGWARLADRWAPPFLWAVLLLAAGAAAVWSVIDPSRAVWVAVSVLIVTCPCALSLAAPSALLSAAGGLARRGVLVQRLDMLETLTRVTRFYLDKTGTVTSDQLQCGPMLRREAVAAGQGDGQGGGLNDGLADLRDWSDASLWVQAAALAAWSSHPASKALVAAAAQVQTLPAQGPWQRVQELPGRGMQAVDTQGRSWRLGAVDWALAPADQGMAGKPRDGLLLSCEGRWVAHWPIDEALRPDAVAAVAQLRAEGLQVLLLSGDRPERAQRMGDRLGVDRVIGGATPEAKLAEVAAAQQAGCVVAMVGDGINDAPVLARADVALAMGQGALLARAQADAVIVSSRLGDLLVCRQLAQRTMRVVKQNFAWAATYNAVCIPLAMAGWLPPWAAGLGMALSSLLVIGNAARLSR